MLSRPSKAWLTLPVVCVVALYASFQSADFVFDDPAAVVENPLVNGQASWLEAFSSDFWGERPGFEHIASWRPLTVLSLRLDAAVNPAEASHYRVVNTIWHAFIVVLMTLFLSALTSSRWIAVLLGCVLATHPVFSEAVASIVGRGDLLASFWGLLGLVVVLTPRLCDAQRGPVAALICAACAMLSKETGVVYAVTLGAIWFRQGRLLYAVWLAGLVAVWFALRLSVVGGLGGEVSELDNPMVTLSLTDRIVTSLGVIGRYMLYALVPQHIAADHAAGVAFGWTDAVIGLITLSGAAFGLIKLSLRPPSSVSGSLAFAGLMLATTSWVLLSSLIVTLPTPLAGRLAYHPAIGVLLLGASVAVRLQTAPPRMRSLLSGVVVAWLVSGIPATLTTVEVWGDEEALFEAAVESEPGSARARANLASHLINRGQLREAEALLLPALDRTPGHPLVLTNYAAAQMKLGDVAGAWQSAVRAVAHPGASAVAFANVCSIAMGRDGLDPTRRLELCREAHARAPRAVEPAVNEARALILLGDRHTGVRKLKEVVTAHPDHPFALGYYVTELLRDGQVDGALRVQEHLHRIQPDVDTQRNLVALLLKAGAEAIERGDQPRACGLGQRALDLSREAPSVERLTAPWCSR